MEVKQIDEPLYCAQQISIPGDLPNLLKNFIKSATKDSPDDILQWSLDYFEKLRDSNNDDCVNGESDGKNIYTQKMISTILLTAPADLEKNALNDVWHLAKVPQNKLESLLLNWKPQNPVELALAMCREATNVLFTMFLMKYFQEQL
ncbi:MAG: Ropporin-1-like protein [Paramarteilia canceri]